MNDKERKAQIEEILLDVRSNLSNYEDFVIDCVRDCVQRWTDEEILAWGRAE